MSNQAKVVARHAHSACKDGDVYPTKFKPGDEIHGELADQAVAEGWGKRTRNRGKKAPANKDAGAAPENKAGGVADDGADEESGDDPFRGAEDVAGSDGGDRGERAEPDAGGSGDGKSQPDAAGGDQ